MRASRQEKLRNRNMHVCANLYFQFEESFLCRSRRCCLRSLRNHDDDGNKNVTNLHIWLSKTIVLHALHVQVSFLTFCRRSRSFCDVKWPVLQLCGRRDHMMTNVKFCLLICKALVRIVRTHFASVMTLNNWEMITETRSYIFRWRSRCRRRRVCVNSLIGSLRSYDGCCSENDTLTYNFALG